MIKVSPLVPLLAGCSYAVVSEPPAPLSATDSKHRRVFGDQGWQDTQIRVNAGESVSIRATGLWTPGGGTVMCTAAGLQIPLYQYPPMSLLFYWPNPISSAPIQELIARVGKDGQRIRVGTSRDWTSVDDGSLYLRPNDWFVSNSSGYVDAQIHVATPKATAITPGRRVPL